MKRRDGPGRWECVGSFDEGGPGTVARTRRFHDARDAVRWAAERMDDPRCWEINVRTPGTRPTRGSGVPARRAVPLLAALRTNDGTWELRSP